MPFDDRDDADPGGKGVELEFYFAAALTVLILIAGGISAWQAIRGLF